MPRSVLIKVRRGTAAEWAAQETTSAALAANELGYESTTPKVVLGDGVTKVVSLPNLLAGGAVSSVVGQTGAVTDADILASTAIAAAFAGKASATHTHAASDVASGVLATARLASSGTASSATFLRGDQAWATPAGATDATTGAKGIVQLAGDLAGTAASPSVAKVAGVAVTGTPTAGQVITASSGTAAAWSTPSGTSPDATTSVKGVVQLANDISGTATAPTVVATHLASALPIAQGGTAATSAGAALTSLGAAAVSHTHSATDLASGTVATARLGSGTASGTTFLRGDQTWAVPSGGGTSPYFDVRAYSAVLDNSTDDHTPLQNAINAASTAGGGTVLVPGRMYLGTTTITVPSNVWILGIGWEASWLRWSSSMSSVMLDYSGTATGGSNHTHHQGLANLTVRGSTSATGTMLRAYYCDRLRVIDVFFYDSSGKACDLLELWDSRFTRCAWNGVGGRSTLDSPNSNSGNPMVHIRNSAVASGFGNGTDNSNMIWFTDCHWEDFSSGALWIERGHASNTSNPNGIYVTGGKFETHRVRSIPVTVGDQCAHIHFKNIDVVLGAFDSTGTPATSPVPGVLLGGYSNISFRDARFVPSDGVASMSSGLEIYGDQGPISIDGISHEGTNPTVAVVNYQGTSGVVDIGSVVSTNGATLQSGTPVKTSRPSVSTFNSGGLSITTTDTALTWDSESLDTHAMHSTSSNTERLTCVIPGVYALTAHLICADAASTTSTSAKLNVNGTTVATTKHVFQNTADYAMEVNKPVRLNVGDYVTVSVARVGGGSNGAISGTDSYLSAHLVG